MSIRYRGFEKSDLEVILKRLVEQKHEPVASVTFNGETTVFRSPAAIEEGIRELEAEIQRIEDVAAGKTRRRSWVFNPGVKSGKGYL